MEKDKSKEELLNEIAELQKKLQIVDELSAECSVLRDALERETAKAKNYLDIAPVILIVLDSSHNIVMINKKGLEVLECSYNDVINKDWIDYFIPALDKESVRGEFKRLMSGVCTDVERHENFVVTKYGVKKYILWQNLVLTNDEGKPVGVLSAGEDVTHLKEIENGIRKINRALKTLSGCNKALMHATDELRLMKEVCNVIVQNGEYKMAWCGYVEKSNEKLVKPVAWSGDENGYLQEITITWSDTKFGRGPIGMCVKTGNCQVIQDIMSVSDFEPWRQAAQKRGYASVIALPIADKGDVFGVLAIYSDEADAFKEDETRLLTEMSEELSYGILSLRARVQHKTMEENLNETNEQLLIALKELKEAKAQNILHERLNALGQLSSGIVHDFNNALSPILGFSDMIIASPSLLNDKDKILKYIGIINTAAKDASVMVTRLRNFYRKRTEEDFEHEVELNKIIYDVVLLTRPKWKEEASAKGITVVMDTELKDIPFILGNVHELREGFTNIIINAIDAMPQGGTITIKTFSENDTVYCHISDTGVGMPESVLKRCFEPFFSTKGEAGSGMGLAMVYGMIQRHESAINVESKEGEGTRFMLAFPVYVKDASAGKKFVRRTINTISYILIVDDKELVLETIKEYLINDGHKVDTATNGVEAFEKFQRHKYDVVITDKAMPEMNGIELADKIKAVSSNTPVIMLTGFSDELRAPFEKMESIDVVLGKPVTLEQLRRAINFRK